MTKTFNQEFEENNNNIIYKILTKLTGIIYCIAMVVYICSEIYYILSHKTLSATDIMGLSAVLWGMIYIFSIYHVQKSKDSIQHNRFEQLRLKSEKTEVAVKPASGISEKLNSIIKNAQNLELSSFKMQEGIKEIWECNSKQNAEIENTSIAIVQLAQRLNEIVNHIESVNTITEKTRNVCSSTAETVNYLNLKTSESGQVAMQIGTKMNTLNEGMREIIKIIGAVKDINKQINILSLNATVEAARAGSAGAGFAVVAGEIRKLADETKNTTKYIEDIIINAQKETTETVRLVKGANLIFKEQEALVADTGNVFKTIIQHMEDVIGCIKQVNSSIEGVNEYKDSATISITMIAGNTSENAYSVENILKQKEENMKDVLKLTEDLKESHAMIKALEQGDIWKGRDND